MKLFYRWIISAIALLAIASFVPGVFVTGLYSALVAALILGVVSLFIRPLLVLLTLPVTVLTFGLFLFVVNALLFWFSSTIVKGFYVTGFIPAFWGALFFSLTQLVFDRLLEPHTYKRSNRML